MIGIFGVLQTERSEEFGKGGAEAPHVNGERVVGPRAEEEFRGAVWSVER